MKLVAVLLVAVLAVATTQPPPDEFTRGNIKFSENLFNEILKKNPNENFVFSPFSLELILALTREGAKGRTEQELTTVLGLPDRESTRNYLRELLPIFKANREELELLSANKIYLDKKLRILSSFKNIATSPAYESDIGTVNFGNNVEAANTINQWVEQQTKNKIKDLISPDFVDPYTKLVLVNGLYFNGNWKFPFDSRLTGPQKFHLDKCHDKDVEMMRVEGEFKYYDTKKGDAIFLDLPYLGENITMTIALPNDIEGLPLLEANIGEVLSTTTRYFGSHRFSVTLPSFKVECKWELKPILQKLGIKSLFYDADLSGISQDGLFVDDVIQKAFVNITGLGTEAAAAPAVEPQPYIMASSNLYANYKDYKDFKVDRPFLFYISLNNIVLFVGRIRKI